MKLGVIGHGAKLSQGDLPHQFNGSKQALRFKLLSGALQIVNCLGQSGNGYHFYALRYIADLIGVIYWSKENRGTDLWAEVIFSLIPPIDPTTPRSVIVPVPAMWRP